MRLWYRGIEDLAVDIGLQGLSSPMLVWSHQGRHLVADGHRRHRALELLRQRHGERFDALHADVPVEIIEGLFEEVLLGVARRNLHANTLNLAALANVVEQLMPWMNPLDMARELDIDEPIVMAALRLQYVASAQTLELVAADDTPCTTALRFHGAGSPAEIDALGTYIVEATREPEAVWKARPPSTSTADIHARRGGRRRPKVKQLKREIEAARERLVVWEREGRRKGIPDTLTTIPPDGRGVWEFFIYEQDKTRLEAQIATLEWVLGDRFGLE